jgi:hypothetical protein
LKHLFPDLQDDIPICNLGKEDFIESW